MRADDKHFLTIVRKTISVIPFEETASSHHMTTKNLNVKGNAGRWLKELKVGARHLRKNKV